MDAFLSYNLGIFISFLIYVLVHFKGSFFKKNAVIFEIASLILISIIFLISLNLFGFRLYKIEYFLQSGHISFGFFLIVMIAGILSKKSILYKRILLIRGELAIMGFIFLLPHALNKLSLALNLYNFTGLIAFILFIPLVTTSFMSIRKKMKPKNWKNLHKLSYIAYFMLYIHVGFTIYISNSIYVSFKNYSFLYHFIFACYLLMKLYIVYKKNKTRVLKQKKDV